MRQLLSTVLKVAVSLGLIVFIFSRVNLAQVGKLIAGANPLLLLLALLLYLGAITLGCVKWWLLLRAQDLRVPFGDLLSFTFVGLFFGNVIPSNVGGDLVRAYNLARELKRTEEAATSVFVDRLVGMVAFMAMAAAMAVLAVAVTSQATNQAQLETVGIAAAVAFLAILAFLLVILSRRVSRRGKIIFRLPFISAFEPSARRIYQTLQAYRRSPGTLFLALCISLGVLILSNFVNITIAAALHIDIPPLYIFLFNPLIAFVLLVPISVGGIGVNQGAYVFFFGLVGVPEVAALSLSLVFQVIIIMSTLPGGVLWLRQRNLRPESAAAIPEATQE